MLQAHGLDREMLQKREVVKIDIANDPVDRRVCALTASWLIYHWDLRVVSLMTDSFVLLQKFGFLMKLLLALFHQKLVNTVLEKWGQRDMEDNYSDMGSMSLYTMVYAALHGEA